MEQPEKEVEEFGGDRGRIDIRDMSRKWQPRTAGHIVSHLYVNGLIIYTVCRSTTHIFPFHRKLSERRL